MQRRIKTIMQEILLLITFLGLICGSFTPTVLSHPIGTFEMIEGILTNEIEQQQDNKETEQTGVILGKHTLQYTFNFSKEDITFDTFLGYNLVAMNGCSSL